jgi:ankyrin repeat protein
MNSRSCRWLIVSALLITASGAQAQRSAPTTKDSIGVPQGAAQAAPQAQKSNAQKLLMDSIQYDKLDVAEVQAALDEGADPNFTKDDRSVIGTLAGPATMTKPEKEQKAAKILEVLFKAGAKLQPCDQEILFGPVLVGGSVFAEVLLKNGVNPSKELSTGETALEMATQHGDVRMVELLKKYGAPALEPKEAARQRLIGAAKYRDIPGMKDAIDAGADVNERNRQGETALVEAVGNDLEPYRDVYLAIMYLLEKGANPNEEGKGYYDNGWTTPLHLAMFSSSIGFQEKCPEVLKDSCKPEYVRMSIQALLQHGALVSGRDRFGETPLHIAARWNNVTGAQLLIDAGCKIMPKDNKGKAPLDYAESAEMIKLLKAHGAKEQ